MTSNRTSQHRLTNQAIRPALVGGLLTVACLVGGLLLGIGAGSAVFNMLPGHSIFNPDPLLMAAAAVPTLLGLLAGSATWGVLIGRLAPAADRRRMAIAGGLGFAPTTILLAFVLQGLEPVAVQKLGAQFPIHRLFTFFFVPSAFLIAGLGGWAIGMGLRATSLAWALLWRAGLAAALAFLTVNLTMEALSWVVGAPHAAERATMLTVMFVSDIGAALAAGGVIGLTLANMKGIDAQA